MAEYQANKKIVVGARITVDETNDLWKVQRVRTNGKCTLRNERTGEILRGMRVKQSPQTLAPFAVPEPK